MRPPHTGVVLSGSHKDGQCHSPSHPCNEKIKKGRLDVLDEKCEDNRRGCIQHEGRKAVDAFHEGPQRKVVAARLTKGREACTQPNQA